MTSTSVNNCYLVCIKCDQGVPYLCMTSRCFSGQVCQGPWLGETLYLSPYLHPTAWGGKGDSTLKSFQGVVHFASVHYKQTRSALSVILVARVSHALGEKGFLASLPSLPRRFVRVFRSNTARVACVYARLKKIRLFCNLVQRGRQYFYPHRENSGQSAGRIWILLELLLYE